MDQNKHRTLKAILLHLKDKLVQEVPPDIAACEVCRKTECSEDEWIRCENRIAHAKCLEAVRARKTAEDSDITTAG